MNLSHSANPPGPVSPPAARRKPWGWWVLGSGALGMLGLASLAFVGNGAMLERVLSPFSFLQQPLIDLAAASKGEDAVDGSEYVAFLYEGREPAVLDEFFRTHPSVRFVSPGLFPGVVVVRVRGDVSSGVQALRDETPVRLVLKSRLGMVCH